MLKNTLGKPKNKKEICNQKGIKNMQNTLNIIFISADTQRFPYPYPEMTSD